MKHLESRSGKRVGGSSRPRYWAAAALFGLALLVSIGLALRKGTAVPREVGFTELVRIADAGGATQVRVEGERFVVSQAGGETIEAVVDDSGARHDLILRFATAGVPLDFNAREPGAGARALTALVPLFVIGLFGLVFTIVQRRRTSGHFTTTHGGVGPTPVRFVDVAGMDEVKEAVTETVEFLKNPEHFGRLGGRAPCGVLLTGAPGTGKTLLARAIATEASVPFLSASGSSFQEMFVGVGASRVRSLFAEARRLAPCIVFIDEIDAVGRSRGRGADAAAAEHDQTLNQLLVEMDGFDPRRGIVVIASTNRPDILDPAVVRPGRFDRQIDVPLPDLRGRVQILEVHARPIELEDEVDLACVARGTPGFSGAELANLLNEAAILAAREGASGVMRSHIERARDRVLMGIERKGLLMDEDERYATAVHEAGHVAVGVVADHTDPVHKVSILPRGRALGVTHSLPERDRLMVSKEYLEDQICMMLGGRAAEIEILGTMTAGAADDIERATALSRRMVAEFGMSELGPICLSGRKAPHSQALLDRVDETTRRLLDAQLERARRIVVERRDEIATLVERLLAEDTLGEDDILACFFKDRRAQKAAA
jgi:cell division protease FtsH